MQIAVHACQLAFGATTALAPTPPHHIIDLLLEMGETEAALRLNKTATSSLSLEASSAATALERSPAWSVAPSAQQSQSQPQPQSPAGDGHR